MKTFKIIIALLCMAPGLTSCLDENPKDQVEESKIYNSANDIYINAVASLYNYIGSDSEYEGLQGTCRGIYDYNTLTTDEAMNPIRGGDWYDGGLWENMYQHKWTEDDNGLYNVWKYLYKVIQLCNNSLHVIETHKSLLTESQAQAYTAEVRAVRALFYYYTMDMFGRVPLVTRTGLTISDVVQSERSAVYRFIIGELQEVAPLLSEEHSNHEGSYYGRVTAPVAYFLLAKLALNAEVYADDDWTDGIRPSGNDIIFSIDGEQLNAWDACIRYCDKLTAMGYALEADYAFNFSVHNETSSENIFTIPLDKMFYAAGYHYLFRSRHYKHGGAYGCASENGTCATISTVRAYGYGTPDVDARFAINFYADTVYVDGAKVMLDSGEPLVYRPLELQLNLTGSPYRETAGARTAKYEVDRTAYSDGQHPNNDIVLFRYADVLLMKAEALARSGRDGSAALNAVRSRVGMPDRECTLDNILQERLLELVWEGWRRQDLIRFGLYNKAYDVREVQPGEQDAHTTVFPIPARTIALNPNLQQNPGYAD